MNSIVKLLIHFKPLTKHFNFAVFESNISRKITVLLKMVFAKSSFIIKEGHEICVLFCLKRTIQNLIKFDVVSCGYGVKLCV